MCNTSIVLSVVLYVCPVSSTCCANFKFCLSVLMAWMCSYIGHWMYVPFVQRTSVAIHCTSIDILCLNFVCLMFRLLSLDHNKLRLAILSSGGVGDKGNCIHLGKLVCLYIQYNFFSELATTISFAFCSNFYVKKLYFSLTRVYFPQVHYFVQPICISSNVTNPTKSYEPICILSSMYKICNIYIMHLLYYLSNNCIS
jgi:hypothetical protein